MGNKVFTSPLFLLRCIASIAYISIGILLLLKPETLSFLDKTGNLALGILLLVYGLYRAWRFLKELRQEK